ncbi:MAG: hypothetical protein U0840_16640 [Gemmataceae bacterium]
MYRRTMLWTASLVLGLLAGPAQALMVAPPSPPARVAASDLVIVGKVEELAEKTIPAELSKGDTRPMQIASVLVKETVLGAPRKIVRVGFFPPMATPAPAPAGAPRIMIRRYPTVQLTAGQEAIFYLMRHPTKKDVYLAQMYSDVVNKKDNEQFARELEDIRRIAKLLADPAAGLTSKVATDRFSTAALLITRYKTQRPGNTKTVPISAEQSKQILQALAEADWERRGGGDWTLNPTSLFFRLNLQAKDGWSPPANAAEIPQAARKWLRDNAATYRLERFVWPSEEDVSAEPTK